jgi:hypothetical protein
MDAGSYLTSRPAGTVIFSIGSAKSGSSDEESPPAYQTTNGKKDIFYKFFLPFFLKFCYLSFPESLRYPYLQCGNNIERMHS